MVIGNYSKQRDEDIEKTDEEKKFFLCENKLSWSLWLLLNKPRAHSMLFLWLLIKIQVLKSIENEIINLMDTNHEVIIEVFKSDDTEI